jgi:peptidoglycan/xylan/chitin deacetylase (PgdA/CDA1 family)
LADAIGEQLSSRPRIDRRNDLNPLTIEESTHRLVEILTRVTDQNRSKTINFNGATSAPAHQLHNSTASHRSLQSERTGLQVNFLRQLTKSAMTVCLPRSRLIVNGPKSRHDRPRVALTFDDGPHAEHTPRLLDKLDELELSATFFVIGAHAKRHSEIVRRAHAAGHEIGNHTYSHTEPRTTTASLFLSEVTETDRLIQDLTGQTPTSVRPPKGELSWGKFIGLFKAHKTISLWNVDPKDYAMTSEDEICRWSSTYEPTDGDIILFHDVHPYAVRAIEILASRGVFDRCDTTSISQWVRAGQSTAGSNAICS